MLKLLLITVLLVALVAASGPLPLLILPFMNASAYLDVERVQVPVGSSMPIGMSIVNAKKSDFTPRISMSSADLSAPLRALIRWKVTNDPKEFTREFGGVIYRVGAAHVRRGQLFGDRPGTVMVQVSGFGYSTRREFLITPVGVQLSATPTSLALQVETSAQVVLQGTATSGVLPAGYFPTPVVEGKSGDKKCWDIVRTIPTPVEQADGRWVYQVDGAGAGSCPIAFKLGEATAVIPVTVTGETKWEKLKRESQR